MHERVLIFHIYANTRIGRVNACCHILETIRVMRHLRWALKKQSTTRQQIKSFGSEPLMVKYMLSDRILLECLKGVGVNSLLSDFHRIACTKDKWLDTVSVPFPSSSKRLPVI